MRSFPPYQFCLLDMLWAFTFTASVLASARFVGIIVALLLGLATSFLVYVGTKRRYWIALGAIQFALIPTVGGFQIYQVVTDSSYVKDFNYRLDTLAKKANLVGADEDVVEKTLGKPTSVSTGWDRTEMDTGKPSPDAKFTTTYNYAPYPSFPYAKFQVHCEDGKVVATEMFDD